jgi:hypothetical protein
VLVEHGAGGYRRLMKLRRRPVPVPVDWDDDRIFVPEMP